MTQRDFAKLATSVPVQGYQCSITKRKKGGKKKRFQHVQIVKDRKSVKRAASYEVIQSKAMLLQQGNSGRGAQSL